MRLLLEIGVGLAGFGMFFLFLGVLLLFDKSLLALGNVGIFYFKFGYNNLYNFSDFIYSWFSMCNRIREDVQILFSKTQN